jgi:hypothetical protein
MRADQIFVVLCECIAFVLWATRTNKFTKNKYWFFTFYLGLIFFTEASNLVAINNGYTGINNVILYFLIPTQITFLVFFLVFKKQKWLLPIVLVGVYLFAFYAELNGFEQLKNTGFTSFSYGVGNLVLIIAVLASISNFLKLNQHVDFYKTPYFWIMLGVVIFYIGSFPYYNFRTFFWSSKDYQKIAYFLHYTSQVFNCIMYLMFGYAAKWIK